MAPIQVLYVDDEPDLLEIGKMFLEKSGDFNVTISLSASEAIRLLEQGRFDTIISDYQMPGMDGIQFLIEVRTRFGPIPFILFTGRGREEVVIQAINSGVDFYLQKGGDPSAQFAELVHKVKSAASRKRADDSLRESEIWHRTILQTTMDGFWIIDLPDGKISDVNETYCLMSGYTRAELLNLKIPDLDASLTPGEQAAQIKRIINQGSGILETRHRRKDGSVFDVELSVTYQNTNGGRLTCFCRDITGRKRAEEAILVSRDQLVRSEADLHAHKAELEMQAEELRRAKLAVEESRDNYLDLYEFAPLGYLTFSDKGVIKEANLTGAVLLGVERNDLINHGFGRFITPGDLDSWDQFFMHLRDQGEKQVCTLMIQRDNGSTFPARLEGVRITDGSKGDTRVKVTISDITDIRDVEEALKKSEEEYRMLVEQSSDGIWLLDKEFLTVYVNPAMEKMLGYSKEEMTGRSWYDFGDPEWVERAKELEKRRQEGVGEPHEFLFIHKDRSKVLARISATPLYDNEGSFDGAIGVLSDITRQKQAEEALAKSEEKLNSILNDVTDVVWSLSWPDMKVHYISPSAEQVYGRPVQEFIDTPSLWAEIVHPDDKFISVNALEQLRNVGSSARECRIVRPDGSIAWIRDKSHLVFDEHGTSIRVDGITSDISEHKEAELAIRQSEDRFRGIFDTITSGVAIYEVNNDGASGRDYIIKDFNRTALELEGKKKEDVVGKRLSDLRPAIDDYGLIPVFRQVWKTGVPEYFPQKIYIDEKYSSWYENRVFRLQSGEIVAVYDDITGRKRSEEALKASEEKYRLMFTTMINGFALLEMMYDESGKPVDCRYVDVNPAHEKLTGLKKEEIIGRTARESIPGLEDYWIENYGRVDQTGTPWYFENYVQGLNRWYGVFVYRTSPGFVAVTFENITERRQAEEAVRVSRDLLTRSEADLQIHQVELETQAEELRMAHLELGESRDKFVDLYDFAPIGYLSLNEQALVTEANLACATLLGMDRKKLVNARFRKFIAQKDSELWVRYFMALQKQGDKQTCNLMLNRSDGSMFPARLESIRITSSDAKPTVRVAVSDITDIREVEETLRESEEKIRLLLNSAAEAIHGLDLNGTCTFCNNSCLRLLGYKHEDELLGRNMHWQIHAKHPDGTPYPIEECRVLKAVHQGKGTHVDDEVLWRADGTSFPVEYWSYPQRHDGKVTGAVVTFLDITERKRAEEALRQANKKLTLLSSITRHDINNQLTIQMGYLSMLEKKQLDPSENEYFLKVSNAAERISAMIRFTKEYEDIGVNAPAWQECRTLVGKASKQAPLGTVMVKNDLPAGMEVSADPLVVRVFYNLMDNAARYGGKITTIRFSALETGDGTLIVCEDDGNGVAAEDKEKIFLRGFGKNTGMGLFLSREILSITGITIRETGEPGMGARFEMTVPKGALRVLGNGA